MDTQVLTPAPGQTIVATETHNRHNQHQWHDSRENQIREGFAFASVQAREMALASTQQVRAEFNATDKQIGDGFTASALADCKTQDAICAAAKDTALASSLINSEIAASATQTLVGFKDLTALSYQIEGRGLLEAAKNASILGIQADKNFYASSVEAVKNAAAAQLEAQKNASAIAAQVAECCCEVKALITSDGNTTRALINQGVVDGLRAQLATAQTTSAAFFARNVAPVVPVAG